MLFQQLNFDLGIAGALEFVEGADGLPMIKIDTPQAQAKIAMHGAHVLSFQPKSAANDVLFLSDKARYEPGVAIRGGIPICWPWFSGQKPHPDLQTHGFARTRIWQLASTRQKGDTIVVRLTLEDDAETRKLWNHAFNLTLEIRVSETLSLSLTTENTGSSGFYFTQALHTYFAVGNIAQTKLKGLTGVEYIDAVGDENKRFIQTDTVKIDNEIDRVYTGFSGVVSIEDAALARKINVTSAGSQTTVVWNPWQAIATEMQDLNDDDYQRFVCVETVNTNDDVITLQAGQSHTMTANYVVKSI